MSATTTPPPARPGLPWRLASMAVMGSVGLASRAFMYGLNTVEVAGLDGLLDVLDRRKRNGADRGLLTVCNHVAVLDDPLMWSILPFRYTFDLENLRWGLGAHDICFKNKFTSTFFSLGQVLPTHRLWHSPLGGPYQPTMDQALKLLSGPSSTPASPGHAAAAAGATSLPTTYSTDGKDSFLAPAAYPALRNAWLHVFPEACCHQNPDSTLRYFKWGVSRFILESDPAPEFIPMFIHGTQHIMSEDRGFPRWAPRVGKRVDVVIGEPTDVEARFGRYREAWRKLAATSSDPESLRDDPEAVRLRIEVAKAVRDEIQKLRYSLGLPHEDDETTELAETWSKEPNKRRFKSPVDGSLVNRH